MGEDPNKRLRILLIDDDEDEYILTRQLLADRSYLSANSGEIGFDLDWTGSYEAARQSFIAKMHDVYLVDYHLGERNGLELLREALAEGCKAPIIILTGQGNYEVDMEAMRSGAADYLVKNEITSQLLERSIRYAIERTQLLNDLNERATRDELTGLFNRREINRRLQDEVNRFQRLGHPVGLALVDIDNFKMVNDTYGHLVGDEVLRRVAKLMIMTIRSIDQAARVGGDEFYLLFPQTTSEQALQVAERLRRMIYAQPFYISNENGNFLRIPISTSVGIASIPGDAFEFSKVIDAADRALYMAKQQGRNRTVSYQSIRGQDS